MTKEADDNEGIISRWSKRKLALREGKVRAGGAIEAPAAANEAESLPATSSESEENKQARLLANLEAAQAVDLETLNAKSDMSVFFREGVPASLKKIALAKLWRSDPVFAGLDELVEYGQNFGDPALNMKTFVSTYKIGKGYLQEVLPEIATTANEALDAVAKSKDKIVEAVGDDNVPGAEPEIEATSGHDADPVEYDDNDGEERNDLVRVPLRQRMDFDHYEV